jgi:hypothetical protein
MRLHVLTTVCLLVTATAAAPQVVVNDQASVVAEAVPSKRSPIRAVVQGEPATAPSK